VHAQRQEGLNYVGVALEAGRLSTDQMRSVAEIARRLGDGDIRLTVWQNFLISGVKDADVGAVCEGIKAIGLDTKASTIRAGLVACTGSFGCKFANADTKRNGNEIVAHIEPRVAMDQPVNVHLTGCPNSCAQHYIGDIGLIGVKVPIGDDDTVPGYNVHVGGGWGTEGSIAKMIYPDIKAEDAPGRVEGLLRAYLAHRSTPDESFHGFANRHAVEALRSLAEEQLVEATVA
jgi:ferredoxin-nitrite reductase